MTLLIILSCIALIFLSHDLTLIDQRETSRCFPTPRFVGLQVPALTPRKILKTTPRRVERIVNGNARIAVDAVGLRLLQVLRRGSVLQ